MTGKHAVQAWLGVCLVSLLTACSQGSGYSDLDQFMAETRAKPRGYVEPLPEFKAYEAFSYSAADRRAPFEPPIDVQLTMVDEQPISDVEPDLDRPREVLENFDQTILGAFIESVPEITWVKTTAALWASVKPELS